MKKIICILFLIFIFTQINPNKITIYNKTNTDIFIAIYYKKAFHNFKCSKKNKVIKINKQDRKEIKRPPQKFLYDRKLLYSNNKKLLKKNMSRYEYKFINKKDINPIYGNKFFLLSENNILICLNFIEYKILKPIINIYNKTKSSILNLFDIKISTFKHQNEIAQVRIGNSLCEEERNFLKKRREKVKKHLEKLINQKIQDNQIPNIAFCLTGGGYRSSIASLGTLIGAKKIGLLDCSSYISTLCGSSLPIISWLASKKTLQKYKKILSKSVNQSVFTPVINFKLLHKNILRKLYFKQTFSLTDLFGFLLADKLLDHVKNKKQLKGISHQAKLMENGDYPLPIYAAIDSISNYEWFEFTPYETGSYFLNTYIPTWSFGRKFFNGKSVNFAPEQTYGFYMGMFCSAFSWSIKDLLELTPKCNLSRKIKNIIQNTFMDETRLYPTKIPNFTYGMENSLMQNVKNFKIIDAGFELVIPIPPLMKKERKIDLIIIGDYSTSMKDLPKLKKYSQKLNFPLPKIKNKNYKKETITIFEDKNNTQTPVLIYMPFIKNNNFNESFDPKKKTYLRFCKNMNFVYNKKQFDLVFGLAKHNIVENKKIILNEIKKIINKKQNKH